MDWFLYDGNTGLNFLSHSSSVPHEVLLSQKLRIWSQLLKKSLMEIFFCVLWLEQEYSHEVY